MFSLLGFGRGRSYSGIFFRGFLTGHPGSRSQLGCCGRMGGTADFLCVVQKHLAPDAESRENSRGSRVTLSCCPWGLLPGLCISFPDFCCLLVMFARGCVGQGRDGDPWCRPLRLTPCGHPAARIEGLSMGSKALSPTNPDFRTEWCVQPRGRAKTTSEP